MIIAQISDTHIAVDGPDADARARDLEHCVRDVNALDPLPDAVIHTGDVAHTGRSEEYERAAAILAALRCPLHVAAGNRDDRLALRATFRRESYMLSDLPFVQYAVEMGQVRLIALDTLSAGTNKGEFCRDRAYALDLALAAGRDCPVALFMHHPPFPVTGAPDPLQFVSHESVSRIERVLARHDNVVRILCGHAHRIGDGELAGVHASTTTSVATGLRMGPYPDEVRGRPVYQLHRFDPQRGFVTETRAAAIGSRRPTSRISSS